MSPLFQITVLLSLIATAVAQAAGVPSEACEALAKKQGKPAGGWMEVTLPDGSKTCTRQEVFCLEGEGYANAQTKVLGCCLTDRLTWIDKPRNLGFCCPAGQHWVGDTQTLKGGCQKIPVPGQGPPPCTGICSGEPVCATENDLGIQYNHCYVLTFPDGKQLGADRDDVNYAKGAYFEDIPFKVCKTTADCSTGAVPFGGSFFLQDQYGRYNDPKATPGWINGNHDGAHIAFTLDPAQAGQFIGSSSCAGGGCYIHLRGGPVGGGLGPACPVETPGITFWTNPKVGIRLAFHEVTCDDSVPPGFATARENCELQWGH